MAGFKMDFPKQMTVQSHTIPIVPRYAETDKGGVIHHSVYPVWFEMGRTELLRVNGIAYKDLEQAGVLFVVARLYIKYRRPAMYDQGLQLETHCSSVSAGKVEHSYRLIRSSDGELLAEGSTVLAHVNAEGKIRRIPEFMYPAKAN
jgi:acyl-CoA thioester hydrolase